jgi:predicted nucleic acid-binding Zn ribbon protein
MHGGGPFAAPNNVVNPMSLRCPECQTINSADETACHRCGLLFLHKDPPALRRKDDFVQQGRRAADRSLTDCPYCLARIERTAVSCRHCGQIVNEEFRRDQLRRRRAAVNYASWVAYVLGLVTLVLFRPVGLIAIGAGLLLSILYYAIPAEGLDPVAGETRIKTWWRRVRGQLKFERVTMRMPAFRTAKLVFVGTPILATVIGYLANFLFLQQPMNEILQSNPSFRGMSVSAHYEYWIVPGVVVYDLRRLGRESTPLQVHTAFLEYARKMKEREFERVHLRFRGQERFVLEGPEFSRAGHEYAKRNFTWVLFDLPKLFAPAGNRAVAPDTAAADALLEFHRKWYADDLR